MTNSKYIVYDNGIHEVGLIFPAFLQHSDMAAAVSKGSEVVGAGFVSFYTKTGEYGPEVVCEAYGQSVSLNTTSRKEDSEILTHMLNLNN